MKTPSADLFNVPGQTPMSDEELDALMPGHIDTREELNAWEAENIKAARRILASRKSALDVLEPGALAELHRMMFGETWKWAGKYRTHMNQFTRTEVPPGVDIRDLVDNTRAMLETAVTDHDIDDVAVRFHHRLTVIHPWPNGNGRHARLAADELLRARGNSSFTWGSGADLASEGERRQRYISALKAADDGDFSELQAFVRS